MKFGFHFTGCAEQREGRIWVRGQFGPFVDALAAYADRIDLLLDQKNVLTDHFETQTDYCIQSPNVRWVSLGPWTGRHARLTRIATMSRTIRQARQDWDFVLIRETSRRSPFVRFWSGRTPQVFLMGGDPSGNAPVTDLRRQSSIWFHKTTFRRAARSALVLVNNEVLLERWRPWSQEIHLTRTTTISERQIAAAPIARFAHQPPYRLLFVGRLGPAKGLDYLLDALHELNDGQVPPRFTLTVVGSGASSYLAALQDKAHQLNLTDAVTWAGFKPLDETLAYYRDADAFILPTLFENLARTIWESMSQCCPVITTAIGGQALAFQDGRDLLFCEPANSAQIAEKVRLLVQDPALRERLITRGLELAHGNTLEFRSRELLDTVAHWLAAR